MSGTSGRIGPDEPRVDAVSEGIRYGTGRGTGLLAAVILGSAIAFLDGTVVNVALPTIGDELGASFAELQWIVTGYTLTLAAFILLAGSLGDHVGRRRIYVIGMIGFAVTSALCALAPNPEILIASRVLQGIAGALLTPGSLAIIQASFHPDDRGKAIGTWAAFGAVAPALGPVVGGVLVEFSWRWVFLINLPIAGVALLLTARFVPESRDDEARGGLDWGGAVLGVVALATMTYALVSVGQPVAWVAGGVAVVSSIAFVWWQRRARNPMVAPSLFADRTFTVTNLLTLGVYAALAGVFFFLGLQLQTTLGYRPLLAGLAGLPSTLIMFALSAWAGGLTTRIGPRIPLIAGPIITGVGAVWLSFVGDGDSYLLGVLPGVLLFGLGLVLLVAPLSTAVLASAPDHLAGTASAVNNAVSRAAGLAAVAALPSIVGLSARDYADPVALTSGYQAAMLICAGLLVAGGLSALALPAHRGRGALPAG